MKSRSFVQKIAVTGALAAFVATLVPFRLYNGIPFIVAGFTYLALLAAFWPRKRIARPALPENVRQKDYQLALERLGLGARRMQAFRDRAPASDGPLFTRMAELLETIRAHHEANPSHVALSRTFVRNTLGRMIESISDYVALAERSGPQQEDRLAEISRGFEGYVPALEKIDQACLDNDLTALEINVEVLNDQLDRKR